MLDTHKNINHKQLVKQYSRLYYNDYTRDQLINEFNSLITYSQNNFESFINNSGLAYKELTIIHLEKLLHIVKNYDEVLINV